MRFVKDPNSIVRVKNTMTGEESHLMYESSDKQRQYHIPAGETVEMCWRDYLDLMKYGRARRYLELDEHTVIGDDGSVKIYDEQSDALIPIEDINELLALPLANIVKQLAGTSVTNLARIKEAAERLERSTVVAIVDEELGNRNSEIAKSET